MLSYVVVLISLLSHCFGAPCKLLVFCATDGEYEAKYDSSQLFHDNAEFACGDATQSFSILSPVYHRKPKEKFITVWIWAKSPLHNVPFGKKKKEFVYIPTDKDDWKKPWYFIDMRIKELTTSNIKDVILKKVSLIQFNVSKDNELIVEKSGDEAQAKTLGKIAGNLKGGDLSQLNPILEGKKIKAIEKKAIEQFSEYVNRLLSIRYAIEQGFVHETVTATRVLLTHPHHSRDDNNQWVLAELKHGDKIITLPFIGKSAALETTKGAKDALKTIATKGGIYLDNAIKTDLKFGKFTPYGLSFTLKTKEDEKSKEKSYEIYWYQQVYGGCVLHALRSVLQKQGEELTPDVFNEYTKKLIAEPCSHCGRENTQKKIKDKSEIYEKNVYSLKNNKECKSYHYCGSEAYLMEHKYHLMQLNIEEVRDRMEEDKKSQKKDALDLGPEALFENIMIHAFKQLFTNYDVHILFVSAASAKAAAGHAWTYMKMNTINEDSAYWLSLDSNNRGAKRVDIWRDLKEKLLKEHGSDGSYDIYSVFQPSEEIKEIKNLWIPQKLKEDTCDKEKGDTEPFLGNYTLDHDTMNQVLLIMLFLVFCFSLITIAGCICGFYAEDVLKKAFAQSKH